MNTAFPPNVVDTSLKKLVPPPGLTKPSNSTQYTSSIVYRELSRYFGDLFPEIKKDEDDVVSYSLKIPGRNDPTLTATPVTRFAEIPESEVFKMLEGWIRMRQDLRNGDVHESAHAILLNLRIPNPAKYPDAYRVFRHQEEDRLLIFWGFEDKEGSSVSLEQAMSTILNIPISRLQSILSASLLSSTPRDLRELPEAQPSNLRQSHDYPSNANWYARISFNQVIMGAAAAIVLFAITVTFLWTTSSPGIQGRQKQTIRDLSGKAYPLPPGSPSYSSSQSSSTLPDTISGNDRFVNTDRWQ